MAGGGDIAEMLQIYYGFYCGFYCGILRNIADIAEIYYGYCGKFPYLFGQKDLEKKAVFPHHPGGNGERTLGLVVHLHLDATIGTPHAMATLSGHKYPLGEVQHMLSCCLYACRFASIDNSLSRPCLGLLRNKR